VTASTSAGDGAPQVRGVYPPPSGTPDPPYGRGLPLAPCSGLHSHVVGIRTKKALPYPIEECRGVFDPWEKKC